LIDLDETTIGEFCGVGRAVEGDRPACELLGFQKLRMVLAIYCGLHAEKDRSRGKVGDLVFDAPVMSRRWLMWRIAWKFDEEVPFLKI